MAAVAMRRRRSTVERGREDESDLPRARRISFSTGVACTALSRAHICGSSSVIDSIALFIALFIAFRNWSTSFSHFSLKSFSLSKRERENREKKSILLFWFLPLLKLDHTVALTFSHMARNSFKIDLMAGQWCSESTRQ